ncbi:MAG: carboxylesterase family protein [Proteobacteria bacterium]|nr:carboxylesterase family protein [Pseudomonadota bacterium]
MKTIDKGAHRTGTVGRRTRRRLLRATLVAAGALSALTVAQGQSQHDANNGPAIRTNEGWVRGYTNGSGVNAFLGIPYAAPPVGALRWQPPQPVTPWHNVLDATHYGHVCAQTTTLGVFAGPASIDEDCLFLNVFTTKGVQGGNAKRPVLVWIHGGGNVDGVSNDYDGSKLATGGPNGVDTVVVTINYRLGLFGYLSHPAIDSEGHLFGNYGILDIQAALRWVQRNIDAFGGDPNRVTLGGQSAGASDTGANVISPMAAGLFHRALFESSPTSTFPPMSVATPRGQNFATAAGCPGSDATTAACLRALSAPQILQYQGTANANGPYVNGPMVDGTIIPITPQTAWTTGRYNQMPMMGGNVQDEANFGIGITEYFSGPPQVPMTGDQYTTLVTNTYSGNAGPGGSPPAYPPGTVQAVLAQYPLGNYATPAAAYDAVSTDPGACRALHVDQLWAQRVPVYAYEFNYQNAPYYFPAMPGFTPLAAHTIDIQFLFPLWHGGILGVSHPLNSSETTLSDQMVAAWTNFAATGNPNGSGGTPWPQFTTSSQQMLSQNIPLGTWSSSQFSQRHQCDFWNQYLVY